MAMTLKEKLATRPVFGMTVYSGSTAVIESLGYWGYDFAFIDGEHTPMGIDRDMEKLVMAAQISGVSPLVRVAKVDAIEIRKAFEMAPRASSSRTSTTSRRLRIASSGRSSRPMAEGASTGASDPPITAPERSIGMNT